MSETPAQPPPPVPGGRPQAGSGLRIRAARGTIINTAFLVGVNTLNLVRGFLVAAFLTTSDYGIWGVILVVLYTLMFLRQVGIGDKFIQQDEADQELAFRKAMTFELSVAGIVLVAGLLLVPAMALVMGNEQIVAPALVALLVVPAQALQAPLWIFYREMDFARQRKLQILDPVSGFVIAVALLVAGWNYWALIVGVVAGAWVGAIVSLRASPYTFKWTFDKRDRSLLRVVLLAAVLRRHVGDRRRPGAADRRRGRARPGGRRHHRARLVDLAVLRPRRPGDHADDLPDDLRGEGPRRAALRGVREVQPPGAHVGRAVRPRPRRVRRGHRAVRHRRGVAAGDRAHAGDRRLGRRAPDRLQLGRLLPRPRRHEARRDRRRDRDRRVPRARAAAAGQRRPEGPGDRDAARRGRELRGADVLPAPPVPRLSLPAPHRPRAAALGTRGGADPRPAPGLRRGGVARPRRSRTSPSTSSTTLGATALVERRLLREILAYLRRRPAAGAAA